MLSEKCALINLLQLNFEQKCCLFRSVIGSFNFLKIELSIMCKVPRIFVNVAYRKKSNLCAYISGLIEWYNIIVNELNWSKYFSLTNLYILSCILLWRAKTCDKIVIESILKELKTFLKKQPTTKIWNNKNWWIVIVVAGFLPVVSGVSYLIYL